MSSDFRKMAKLAARAADEKKAEDLLILDIRRESDVADYMVIAESGSSAQMRAIYDTVLERLAEAGARLLHREGRTQDRWMVLDYGGLVIHILLSEARRFYRLENLWESAKPVKWKPS